MPAAETPSERLRAILRDLRILLADPTADYGWSSWFDAEHAVREIDELFDGLATGTAGPEQVAALFVPTGPAQEVALSSGWGDAFGALADRVDAIATEAARGVDLDVLLGPPATVGALAAALGLEVAELVAVPAPVAPGSPPPDGPVAFARATFAVDHHHESPPTDDAAIARRPPATFIVSLRDDRAPVEARLRERYGDGVDVAGDEPLQRFGPFLVDPGSGPGLTLRWYATLPDWASPPPDPRGRERALARLLAAPPGAVDFTPPLPVAEIVAALGLRDPLAVTVGIYMDRWRLAEVVDGVVQAPRADGWFADAWLEGPPTGPNAPGLAPPAALARRLGPSDRVRSLELRGP